LETSTGSLFTYAQACTSLKRLYIGRVTPQSISALCLLLVFPPSLEKIKIEYIEGSLGGHYDWSPKGQQQDTYLQLIDILEKMLKSHDLKLVHFGKAKWLLPEHQRNFQELMEKRNCNGSKMRLSVGEMDNERTKEEVSLENIHLSVFIFNWANTRLFPIVLGYRILSNHSSFPPNYPQSSRDARRSCRQGHS